jgi:hypothetical protein
MFFLFTVFVFSIPAQTENATTTYVIREIDFNIEGRTLAFMLVSKGEFKAGEVIEGRENFEKYLALKKQLLVNERLFDDVTIEYSLGRSEENGTLPVSLLVSVKDSRNFIVLPYPKHTSGDGTSITLKVRDYNFLGTMNPLRVDLGYRFKDSDHVFNFMLETDIPFQAAGLNWNIRFSNDLSYNYGKRDSGEKLYYQNITGLSLTLPWRQTSFNVGFNQYFRLNEGPGDESREIYGIIDKYYDPYTATELFAFWYIPLGITVGQFGSLAYVPRVAGRINYPYGDMDEVRKPMTTFSHYLGFGRIDWIGNYRKGLSFSLYNENNLFLDRPGVPVRMYLSGEIIFHQPFSEYVGISSRLLYRQWWNLLNFEIDDRFNYNSAGGVLRGVLNGDIRADYILSLNLDIPIRILRFRPSEWYEKPKLRFFDIDLFFSPFIDTAMFRGPYNKFKNRADPRKGATTFSLDDMINTTGLEVIVYSDRFRSLRLRGSLGYNIQEIKRNGLPLKWDLFPQWDEIYSGMDLHY